MQKAKRASFGRYQFAWINQMMDRKRLKIQLTDSREPKNEPPRYKGRFRRFLIRLRSD